MKCLSEEQRRQRIGAFLAGVTAVAAQTKAEAPRETELPQQCLNVLVKAALEPGVQALEVYKTLGQHPAEGKTSVEGLVARGMVRVHRLARKGRGGQPQVLEVLPAGVAELAKRGIKPAEKKLKRGGFKHDVYARGLEKWAQRMGYAHWFERTLGVKAFDFVYQDNEGRLVAIEICLSGTAKWNAEQALKGATVAGVEQVVVACEEKELLTEVERKLKELDALGVFGKKVAARLVADYLEA